MAITFTPSLKSELRASVVPQTRSTPKGNPKRLWMAFEKILAGRKSNHQKVHHQAANPSRPRPQISAPFDLKTPYIRSSLRPCEHDTTSLVPPGVSHPPTMDQGYSPSPMAPAPKLDLITEDDELTSYPPDFEAKWSSNAEMTRLRSVHRADTMATLEGRTADVQLHTRWENMSWFDFLAEMIRNDSPIFGGTKAVLSEKTGEGAANVTGFEATEGMGHQDSSDFVRVGELALAGTSSNIFFFESSKAAPTATNPVIPPSPVIATSPNTVSHLHVQPILAHSSGQPLSPLNPRWTPAHRQPRLVAAPAQARNRIRAQQKSLRRRDVRQ